MTEYNLIPSLSARENVAVVTDLAVPPPATGRPAVLTGKVVLEAIGQVDRELGTTSDP